MLTRLRDGSPIGEDRTLNKAQVNSKESSRRMNFLGFLRKDDLEKGDWENINIADVNREVARYEERQQRIDRRIADLEDNRQVVWDEAIKPRLSRIKKQQHIQHIKELESEIAQYQAQGKKISKRMVILRGFVLVLEDYVADKNSVVFGAFNSMSPQEREDKLTELGNMGTITEDSTRDMGEILDIPTSLREVRVHTSTRERELGDEIDQASAEKFGKDEE